MAQIKKLVIYSERDPRVEGIVKSLVEREITPEILASAELVPTQIYILNNPSRYWMFKGIVYEVNGVYTKDQIQLLVIDEFDKERKLFEKLKLRYEEAEEDETYTRIPIPERVRIEVWRRDGGKCVKCSSRERLEYDHIIPVSKGGGNTARNIELLCETCNRSKGAKI